MSKHKNRIRADQFEATLSLDATYKLRKLSQWLDAPGIHLLHLLISEKFKEMEKEQKKAPYCD